MTVHLMVYPGGSTECCDKLESELDYLDSVTDDESEVTCTGED